MKKLWKCPKCKREFAKEKQMHSCTIYPVEKHFKNKEYSFGLYNKLKKKMREGIGDYKIESLPCCIHFVKTYTFGAVFALKDRIRISFGLEHKIETKKKHSYYQISKNRHYYRVDILNEKELDKELIGWIKEAYKIKKKN